MNAPGMQEDPSLHLQIGKCYLRGGHEREAEESFQTTILLDQDNIEARVELARMYEDLDDQEQAFIYVNDLIRLRREQSSRKRQSEEDENNAFDNDVLMPTAVRRKSYYQSKRLMNKEERRKQEAETAERLLEQYSLMRLERNGMRAGDPRATKAWMDAAADMIEDFRSFKQFYSSEKYMRFLGYTTGTGREQPLTGATPLDTDLAEMASRISSRRNIASQVNTTHSNSFQDLGAMVKPRTRLHQRSPKTTEGYHSPYG